MNILGTMLLTAAVSAASTDPPSAEEFYQDFREGIGNTVILRQVGPNAPQMIRAEPNGLRITLPAKRTSLDAVGVAPRFWLHGDFEITAGFELLGADRLKGYGAGIRIRMKVDEKKTVSLGRVVRAAEGNVFVAQTVLKGADGKEHYESEFLPARYRTGKLRLARTGKSLSFLVADGNSDRFQEVYRTEVGDQDMGEISLSATTGGKPGAVDVRLLDLRIQAEKLPAQPAPSAKARWPWWVGGFGITVVLASGLMLYRRRLREGDEEQAPHRKLPKAVPCRPLVSQGVRRTLGDATRGPLNRRFP